MMKCDFRASPVGGVRCSVCGFNSDEAIDRDCPGALAIEGDVAAPAGDFESCCDPPTTGNTGPQSS